MSKLIIKREKPLRSPLVKRFWIISFLFLLLISIAGFMWYKSQSLVSQALWGSSSILGHTMYQQEQIILQSLIQRFELESKQGGETKSKNERLIQHIEAILLQLDSMDRAVEFAKVDKETQQTLLATHQYQKDYWSAQHHFQELRLSHFEPLLNRDSEGVFVTANETEGEDALGNVPKTMSSSTTQGILPQLSINPFQLMRSPKSDRSLPCFADAEKCHTR